MKRIGKRTFFQCPLVEIESPEGVEELSEECFSECKRLSDVGFGEAPSLKRVGDEVFYR